MFFNRLMEWYDRFSVVSLLYTCFYAGSCKNEAASKNVNLKTYTTSNSPALDQKDDSAASKSNGKRPSKDAVQMESNNRHKNSKNHSAQTNQVDTPPIFTLQDITIQPGTKQSTMLKVTDITEGYVIKSISVKEVKQNGSYHTSKFGVDILKNKPIPPSGLPITLTSDPTLKAGPYELKIRIGKTGKGSRQTEQWVKCRIHIIEDESKNNCPSKYEADTAENIQGYQEQNYTTPAEPSFTLKDVTIQAGTEQSTILEVAGITEGYSIHAISIKKNTNSYTKKLGLDALKGTPRSSSGLSLPGMDTLKPGVYVIKHYSRENGRK